MPIDEWVSEFYPESRDQTSEVARIRFVLAVLAKHIEVAPTQLRPTDRLEDYYVWWSQRDHDSWNDLDLELADVFGNREVGIQEYCATVSDLIRTALRFRDVSRDKSQIK